MAPILGGLFRKLTGAGGTTDESVPQVQGEAVEYNGYQIYFTPKKSGAQWLTAGLIVKETPEGRREQAFIRAETHPGQDSARDFAMIKARQIIDEQGDRLFKDPAPAPQSSDQSSD